MKIVSYHAPGGPEVLQIDELPIPQPEEGQILLKVQTADIAFIAAQRRGSTTDIGWRRESFPVAPGGFVYGTVVQVGPGISHLHKGEPLLAYAPSGAYAEYALVSLDTVYQHLPSDNLSAEEIVALPSSGETAYHVLTTSARLQPGESVLIHAAAGGVGHLAVQLARALGAGQIIATASSTAKLDFARSLGADTVINYSETDWDKQVLRATQERGVDVILEMVGGEVLTRSLKLLAPSGRLVTYGIAGGNLAPIQLDVMALSANKQLMGFSWFALNTQHPERIEEGRRALLFHVKQGQLRPVVTRTFSLAETAEAHQALESRATYGKIVLRLTNAQ
ncbi:NADPH:quinone oxidoreductase family protein [Ktedonosporobacter rubrisoli]|uniref:NADPH:quinone oxidoreductase family protein n=1 Tax=Ktedonosporobacter rubrisoli TaxID=2509675 RepID=A0A4P6JX99_KTERU|nr:NADPH:quinone oxidoreductase family protein [Ktedonosporobacter rubrisoli]QBD80369.1 NADPH:quinone oxidoreductase family protein [Ktedonosporobacter rubrisoli]